MTLKSQISSDLSNVFLNVNEFAELLTYKVSGTGSGTSVTAVIDRNGAQFENEDNGLSKTLIYSVWLSLSDVATPTVNDTVVIDTLDWQVVSVERDGYGGVMLEVLRTEYMERSAQNHRTTV